MDLNDAVAAIFQTVVVSLREKGVDLNLFMVSSSLTLLRVSLREKGVDLNKAVRAREKNFERLPS